MFATKTKPTASTKEEKSKSSTLQKKDKPVNRTGLPDRLKDGIENLSGLSIDDVRVHYNSPRPAQLQALAYTQGTDIYVAPQQERHVPHEAWHVVQQMQGRVRPTMQMKGIDVNDDLKLEEEADEMGDRAIQGKFTDEAVQLKRVNNVCVQRAIPVNALRSIGVNPQVTASSTVPTAEVYVKANGAAGNENDVITKDFSLFGNGKSAKENALIAIATMAGNIGDIINDSSVTPNLALGENFFVSISAKYRPRSNKWGLFRGNTKKL